MQRTLLMVNTTHASHATRLAAMQAANAALVSYTLTDTVLPLPAADPDVADYSLIDCLVPNASRTGDIAWAHRDNIGDDYFIMELATDDDAAIFASRLLDGTVMFVRQEVVGGYGTGTGKTWKDAANGWGDTTALGATFTRGTMYVACGCNWAFRDAVAFASVNDMPAFPAGTGTPVEWRMDLSLDPGMNYAGFVDRTTTSNTWTRPDAVNHPRVWKATLDNLSGTGRGHFLLPIDPTLSTSDIYTNHLFGEGGSQAGVEANVLTAWVNTGTKEMWIHMPDDTDPTDRIGRSNNFGYNPAGKYGDGVTAKQDFDFIMCQIVGCFPVGNGGMGTGSGNKFPKARFLGGRYLFGASWKPFNVCISGTEWGRAERGNVTWDTSDRPDPATDTYIAKAVAKGADQKILNRMNWFIEIDSAEEGVYWVHSGTTDNPDDGKISGRLCRHIGEVHPQIAAKFGNTINYNDGDSHAWAHQGGSGWTVEYDYVEKAGSAYNLYAISDSTNAQSIQNNVVQYCVIRDNHTKYSVQNAGMNAIKFNGDGGAYARSNGTGNYAGNIIRGCCLANIIGDPDSTAFGTPGVIADGEGITMHLAEELLVQNVHFVNCTHAFNGQRNGDMSQGDGSVNTPATGELVDPQIKYSGCTFEEIVERIVHSRFTQWEPTELTVSDISNANPAVITTDSVHGWPDVAQPGVLVNPRIYLRNQSWTGNALADGVYEFVWTSTTQGTLKDTNGTDIDGTTLGTFNSGTAGRANTGYIDGQNNTIILASGETASTDKYRIGSSANQTLAEVQALTRNALPGATSTVYESGTSIAA